ncbi:MAG: chemotaxis protein CheW [Desulfobacterales bacterium]|nr:chemotaxis protein CheW [Desulfobacterales bacterium]
MGFENDQNIITDFIVETNEHLDDVEKTLLLMEQTIDTSVEDVPENIAEIFRFIHSIKGAAGFLKFEKIEKVSHRMEALFDLMRNGRISPSHENLDVLLTGLDKLKLMMEDVHRSNEVDVETVLEQLNGLINTDSHPITKPDIIHHDSAAEPKKTIIPQEDASFPFIKDDYFKLDDVLIQSIPFEHDHLYLIKYNTLELGKRKLDILSLINTIITTGAIVDYNFVTEGLDSLFCIVYSTILDSDFIPDLCKIDKTNFIELNKDKLTQYKDKEQPLQDESKAKHNEQQPKEEKQTIHVHVEKEPYEVVEPKSIEPVQKQEKFSTPVSHGSPEKSETIRIKVDLIDRLLALAGELVLVRNQQNLTLDTHDDDDSDYARMTRMLDKVTTELQETVMLTRMQPIGNLFSKLPRIVRDVSKKLNKKIEIHELGGEVEMDKKILESLTDPLIHIIRNSCDHGIELPEERIMLDKPETGQIIVQAFHEAGQIHIRVIDDGKGIDVNRVKQKAIEKDLKTEAELEQMTIKDTLSLILLPGFSTAEKITEVSGRGVGMDVVKSSIEQFGGVVDIDSVWGQSTTIYIRLPLTLAIIPCLIVHSKNNVFAIPQVNVSEIVRLYKDEDEYVIEKVGNQEVYRFRDQLLPIVRLNELLMYPEPFTEKVKDEIIKKFETDHLKARNPDDHADTMFTFIVVKMAGHSFGLVVDQVIGMEEIVVKPMHSKLKTLGIYSGATLMGDGQVALILDIEGIAKHVGIHYSSILEDVQAEAEKRYRFEDIQQIMLFKSGEHETFAVPLTLIDRIERFEVSNINKIGNKDMISINDVPTLVLRLDQVLDVSPVKHNSEMMLLLPKFIKKPVGILMSEVVDTCEISHEVNFDTYSEDGLLGTSIVNNQITLFVDIFRIVEKAQPDWFLTRQTKDVSFKDARLLVLEDSAFFRQLITKYLESDGYRVDVAKDGSEGLKLFKKNSYHLIISDIEMPVMNGWKFIEHVRTMDKNIPALALTSLYSEKDRTKSLEAGFNSFYRKIDREDLLKGVYLTLMKSKQTELTLS